MTSRRLAFRAPRYARAFGLALVMSWIAACASLPNDAPVVEQLDEETGLTIARLGHPLELYRDTFRQNVAGKFAFLGPFETNQMGRRELYLWVAIPLEDAAANVTPIVSVDGAALDLAAPGRGPDAAGLQHAPYKTPMSWIAMFYYRIDADVVAKLGAARSITIQATEATPSGPVTTSYSVEPGQDPRLREFSARQAN
jgi:hypothetical protein